MYVPPTLRAKEAQTNAPRSLADSATRCAIERRNSFVYGTDAIAQRFGFHI